jgi:hypothetical protein
VAATQARRASVRASSPVCTKRKSNRRSQRVCKDTQLTLVSSRLFCGGACFRRTCRASFPRVDPYGRPHDRRRDPMPCHPRDRRRGPSCRRRCPSEARGAPRAACQEHRRGVGRARSDRRYFGSRAAPSWCRRPFRPRASAAPTRSGRRDAFGEVDPGKAPVEVLGELELFPLLRGLEFQLIALTIEHADEAQIAARPPSRARSTVVPLRSRSRTRGTSSIRAGPAKHRRQI